MIIYIDESGSINNHISNNKYFIIALIHATDKNALKRAYKRFVSSNYDKLPELDKSKFFPENYLNTELSMNGTATGKFDVTYYDSSNNHLIQIADVFANLYYSHLQTDVYKEERKKLENAGILRFIFEFPKRFLKIYNIFPMI